MGNFFSDLFGGGEVPKAPTAGISNETNDLLNGQLARSKESTGDITNQITQNAHQNLAETPEQSKQHDIALGSANPGLMSDALSKRSQKYIGDSQARQKNNATTSAMDIQHQRVASAASNLQSFQKIQVANYQAEMKRYNAQVQARNAAISGIFQTAGMGVGMAMGGPAGASAGGQAGAAVGGMAASGGG